MNKQDDSKQFLEPGNMLRLYTRGAFPMADDQTGEISWFLPEIRTIIPLEDYNVPRSLKKFNEKNNFEIRFDFDFLPVVKACAERESTWISKELINAYLKLNELGYIHTVEVWEENHREAGCCMRHKLIGGLYGVSFNGAFFGESMFSRESQASKIALIKLIEHLNEKNFVLLDVQYITEHLKMFGAKEISFDEYNNLLAKAHLRECEF